MKDEYRVDLQAGGWRVEVDGAGKRFGEGRVVGVEDGGEGPDFRVGGEDVAWCDDILEAIALGDVAALLAFAADYQDGGVSW